MFKETVPYYDLIHLYKDYATEAGKIVSIVKRANPTAESILDVACGTGQHAKFLSRQFTVDGIDIEPAFVKLAQERVPAGRFEVADMRKFDLGRRYDVVICLFSSIGYLSKPREVADALACFTKHLSAGGVVVLEPWFTPAAWRFNQPWLAPTIDEPDVKICGITISRRRGNMSVIDFQYLIGESSGIRRVRERHELALYTVAQMQDFFKQAGLRAVYDEGVSNRGLYVAKQS